MSKTSTELEEDESRLQIVQICNHKSHGNKQSELLQKPVHSSKLHFLDD